MNESSTAYEAGHALGGVFVCFILVAVPVIFIVSLILAIIRKSKGWTVTAVVMGIVGIGAVAAFLVFSANRMTEISDLEERISHEIVQDQKLAEENGPPVEFKAAEGGWSVLGPRAWREQSLGNPSSNLEVGNRSLDEFLMVISEKKADFDAEFTLDRFADISVGATIKVVEDPEYSELETLMLDGLPARRHRLNGTINGVRIAYVNTYIEGAEHFHQVLAWTLEEKQDEVIPRLREAADTFRESTN